MQREFSLVAGLFAGCALIALPLAAQDGAPAAQSTPLTLPEAVGIALEHSPELGQSAHRALAVEAARDQAARQWLPKLSIEGAIGARHLENDRRIALGLSARDQKPLYASVNVDQPVFDMGRRQNAKRSEAERAEAAWAAFDNSGEAAAYGVARVYLELLLYQRLEGAAADNLAFHEQISRDMREGVTRGAMSIAERQQADERRQQARISMNEARDDLQGARNQFAALVGTLGGELTMPEDPASGLMPASLDEAIAVITVGNAKVKEAERMLASAEASERRARSELGPTVDLRGTARNGSDFDGYGGRTRDYSAMASLRWSVWDGGVTAARIREANHRSEEARFSLIETQRDNERNARNSWQKLSTWQSKLTEQEERATIAHDLLGSYRAQFGIGRRSLLDVLDAQSASYNAVSQAEVSRFGTLLARYEILAMANRLREHFGIKTDRASVVGPYGPR